MSLFNSLLPSRSREQAEAGETAGPAMVAPRYEIKETAEAFGLEVWLPGVAKDGLELTIHEGELTIVGRRAWKQPETWTQLYRETPPADYSLTLAHDRTFDAEKVQAELRDGLLHVTLPKAATVKPRRIAVT